jgi:serine/threonine protein kinase
MAFLRRIGNYELTESLGTGAFGEVFRGTNTRGEVVAIKCISKDRLDSRLARYLEREIATLQGINSPYVIQLYEVIQTGKNIYLAMEYCAGEDLEKTMRKLAAVPMHLARRWLTNIVDAFLALKEKKIMHRDLKPANVILTHTDLEQAYAKLADFGLAKFDGNNGARIDQSTVGSPLYMAPEILDQLPYNSKVDVWSFGVLASTLLGTRLFKGILEAF